MRTPEGERLARKRRTTRPAPVAIERLNSTADRPGRPIVAAGAAALLLVLAIAPSALGCPVCYGAPDDPMVKGVNNGIWVLLGLVGAVQIGFVAMFWSFWRRAREQRRFRESLRLIEGGPNA